MVESVRVPDEDAMASAMIAEMDEFVEAQPPEPTPQVPRADAPPLMSQPAADQAVGALPPSPPDELVVLTNLDFVHEVVMLPREGPDGRLRYSGRSVQFQDGHLITDPATAAIVLAACPHVYAEPKEGPVFKHSRTGFQTRSASGFERYTTLLAYHS